MYSKRGAGMRVIAPRLVLPRWREQKEKGAQQAEELLRHFSEAVGAGSDQPVLMELSRQAQTLFVTAKS
jgi:hypothetical protein